MHKLLKKEDKKNPKKAKIKIQIINFHNYFDGEVNRFACKTGVLYVGK